MQKGVRNTPGIKRLARNKMLGRVWKKRWIYFLLLPGILYYAIFKYGPMWGLLIAFKDYSPFAGFGGSPWVGFSHFQRFFTSDFQLLMRNTLWLGILSILFYFPIPIILALLLNEIRRERFKKTVQTLIYIPHFFSWVIIVGITYIFFNADDGVISVIAKSLGGTPTSILTNPDLFRPMIILQQIWKEAGWGTIIFLAALAGVDVCQYEAARMDGANRLQQAWYITLPAIKSIVVTLLILRLGSFLDTGFEQILLMTNGLNRGVAEVFDTFVYQNGVILGDFSYTTAAGLFKSLVGLILILVSNSLAKRFGEEGII